MRSLMSGLLAIGFTLLAQGSAAALDPASIDILGFRLGMTRADVRAALTAQGSQDRMQEERSPCPDAPTRACVSAVLVHTRDGLLTVRFDAGSTGRVRAIIYTLNGRGPGEPAIIRAAVADRFGRPDSLHPMAWCRQPMRAPSCPADQPRLSFEPQPDGTSVLTLSSAGT